jgi:hypothetical protein
LDFSQLKSNVASAPISVEHRIGVWNVRKRYRITFSSPWVVFSVFLIVLTLLDGGEYDTPLTREFIQIELKVLQSKFNVPHAENVAKQLGSLFGGHLSIRIASALGSASRNADDPGEAIE